MQALFFVPGYPQSMATTSHLRSLREASGLSLRELARQIDEQPTNLSYWERSGKLPKSDVLMPIAKALGVSVEEVLGQGKIRKNGAPAGKLGQAFEAISNLPRRQQQKILDVIEALLAQQNVNQSR